MPAAASARAARLLSYPQAERLEHIDDYHGVAVADPYRWLEEPDSPQLRDWIAAQNALTESFLAQVPQRAAIKARLTKLWNYERWSLPSKEGGRYYYGRNDGLQNQNVILVSDTLDGAGEARVFIDPNELSADGTLALGGLNASKDGRYAAYATAQAGSDWHVWRVRDLASGQDLADRVEWSKFSVAAWSGDSKGFFYAAFPPPGEGEEFSAVSAAPRIMHHVVGTAQAQDQLVYERHDQPEWYLSPFVSDDDRYLLIAVNPGRLIHNGFFYKDLQSHGAAVVELLGGFDAQYTFIGNDGPLFYVQTDLEAPRGRIVAIDTRTPDKANWTTHIPQADEALLKASLVGGHFVLHYLKDARSVVRVFDRNGAFVREVELPGIGTVDGFDGRQDDPETFYLFTGFTTPAAIYRYDVATGASTLFRQARVDFDPSRFETKQVFYASKDGTRVPMFLTHRKGLELDGANPTILYGYGGFNIPLTPAFSVANLAWVEMGGVHAVACLRGGGEYGEAWHVAGTRLRKQNTFDDFIAAAEWLTAKKYTSAAHLAIQGRSNGGLLVGAAMTQRPQLFAAALPGVGVLDMMRFHKFTVGWGWVGDYGSSDDPTEARALRAYSPYHNLEAGSCYPATLVHTADHDDRVYPAHSFKFAAALQHAQSCDRPALIRIETRAGHGMATPTAKKIEETADLWTFLVAVLGMNPTLAA